MALDATMAQEWTLDWLCSGGGVEPGQTQTKAIQPKPKRKSQTNGQMDWFGLDRSTDAASPLFHISFGRVSSFFACIMQLPQQIKGTITIVFILNTSVEEFYSAHSRVNNSCARLIARIVYFFN